MQIGLKRYKNVYLVTFAHGIFVSNYRFVRIALSVVSNTCFVVNNNLMAFMTWFKLLVILYLHSSVLTSTTDKSTTNTNVGI